MYGRDPLDLPWPDPMSAKLGYILGLFSSMGPDDVSDFLLPPWDPPMENLTANEKVLSVFFMIITRFAQSPTMDNQESKFTRPEEAYVQIVQDLVGTFNLILTSILASVGLHPRINGLLIISIVLVQCLCLMICTEFLSARNSASSTITSISLKRRSKEIFTLVRNFL